MNIKDYIDSGIVATYVLGLATEDEQKEFEFLCSQYPELIEATRSFEEALENRLRKEAVPVPDGLKEKILSSLNAHSAPIRQMHVTEKEYKTPVRRMNAWKLLAAACILLLTVSSYYAYFFMEKYQKTQRENSELRYSLNKSISTNPIVEIDPIVKKPSVKWSAMFEPKDSSHCMAHIYWDSVSANTFLSIGNIPPPVSDKQFQLWALLGNEAINLGMFDIKQQGKVVQMKSIQKANTFVITIERTGGSAEPSMEAMYAIGKL